jgi:hypothetical protein
MKVLFGLGVVAGTVIAISLWVEDVWEGFYKSGSAVMESMPQKRNGKQCPCCVGRGCWMLCRR